MNITNVSKSNQLQQDFQNVKNKLQSFFNTTAIISANIISSKLTKAGYSYISVKVSLREDGEIINKHSAFLVVNGQSYSVIPFQDL